MGFRLKTSKNTKEIFEDMTASSNLKPFALSKIAVCMSLSNPEPIDNYPLKDSNGLELQRSTVTGEFDELFKSLIEMNLGRHLNDDEYYPDYMKLHMDRGAELLLNAYKYSGRNLEKFIANILSKGDVNL